MDIVSFHYIMVSHMPAALLDKLRKLLGGHDLGGKKRLTDRETRYVIHGSLIYRPTGGMAWYRGTTENLSSTGVLFHGETSFPVDTPIEMSITPPATSPQKPDGVFCWGTVVRSGEPNDASATPLLAAKITKFRTQPKFLSDADIQFQRLN